MFPRGVLDDEGILNHIAHASAGEHFRGLVVDVSVLADDRDGELPGDSVARRDAGTVVGDDEWDIRADQAVTFLERGDEDDAFALKEADIMKV